jgi:hypothetical protein
VWATADVAAELRRLALLAVVCSLLGAVANGQGKTQPSSRSTAVCRVDSLPAPIQHHLQQEFAEWRIQEVSDLNPRARERWNGEKVLTCPGIASGHFESPATLSFALLLVAKANADAGFKFVVFSVSADKSAYKVTILDKADAGRANRFIAAVPVSKFFDEASRKRFKAFNSDAILQFDSAENEYEVDVYYFSEARYRNNPVDY